jgi:hypothetical protein
MKIQAIPMFTEEEVVEPAAEVVMLKMSGPVDPNDAVVVRARKMVLRTGSRSMIKSFDRAVERGTFVTEE